MSQMTMAAPVLLVLYFGFWAWMIIECATFEKGRFTKVAWLIFLVPGGPIVGVVYYMVRILPRVFQEGALESRPRYQVPPLTR